MLLLCVCKTFDKQFELVSLADFQSQYNIYFCHSVCFKTKIKVETTLVATGSPFLPLLDTPPLFADNEICQRRVLLEKLKKPYPSGIKVWSNSVLVQKKVN